ncbi:MAG: OmpA family protein [Rubrivivax sp.]|nr:OmpA family protein [Rubrivivax sp.]
MTTLTRSAAVAALAAALSACQTTPPGNPDLEAARTVVSQASSNPYAARSASVELQRAQQALRRAESAWADNRDREETQHLSYLTQRRAETTLAIAQQAQNEERLQQAGSERERVRLEARTREVEAARRNASAAQASAQSAQGQVATAQQQTEQARREAEAARQQLAQQAERSAAMERDLQTLQARSTQRGMVVTLGDVFFSTGRADLQPGAQRNVQQLANVLRQYPERRVLIEGFTDSQGSDELNMELSQRRAEAFRRALVSSGVETGRIELRAHGKSHPVASNDTAAGRQQNRRVEVLFSDPQGRFGERP